MTEPGGGPEGPGQDSASGEPVGSVGEEAAKLFGALSDWARDQGSEHVGAAGGAASAVGSMLKDVNEHIATGSEDCRYCPVCQVVHAVRQTSPEVRAHLAVAASSLMHAAAGLLATPSRPGSSGAPVEKIDLDGDESWDDR